MKYAVVIAAMIAPVRPAVNISSAGRSRLHVFRMYRCQCQVTNMAQKLPNKSTITRVYLIGMADKYSRWKRYRTKRNNIGHLLCRHFEN